MKFSTRIPSDLSQNSLSEAIAHRKTSGQIIIDLSISNPTQAGFVYPAGIAREAFLQGATKEYQPDPRGFLPAREAIALYYREKGSEISPSSIFLTSGTSEAYSFLFKLLCNPGEEVMSPTPSYPLIELIARLEGVSTRTYVLPAPDWRYSIDSIKAAYGRNSRAVIAISPNNPTGTMLTEKELSSIRQFCRERGMALIVDEVFLDYPGSTRENTKISSAQNSETLTFTLGGLSKSCGLPQMKVAWIAISGPEEEARAVAEKLEFIADAFLSVGTPNQYALPELLAAGEVIRSQIRSRVETNERTLKRELQNVLGLDLYPRDGGWYTLIGLPKGFDDEDITHRLLTQEGIIVQPGYFYDFPDSSVLVVSLLPPEDEMREGANRLSKFIARIVKE